MTVTYRDIKEHLHRENNLLYLDEVLFSGFLKKQEDDCLVERQYLNGLPHGLQKTFFHSGRLKRATLFTNGVENGRRIEYYPCGSKKMNANYSVGELDGIYEEWDDEGILIVRKTYFKGKLIAVKSI
ncbi:MAG: hypothetical protein COA58_07795 [Bacteroidetes bacterium]|nr:MAG: hypothetical protein COA58_07795 [Bacteroidota bacterium]